MADKKKSADKQDKKSKKAKLELAPKGLFDQKDFVEVVVDTEKLLLFKCPSCGGVHFRHAGYVEAMIPFVSLSDPARPQIKSSTSSLPVKICVDCKHSFVDYLGKMQDITQFIKLDAWEKTEKEAQAATGPGGEC